MTTHNPEPGAHVVHPAHGIGNITGKEAIEIAGATLDVCVISFARSKLTLRVPGTRMASDGIRDLVAPDAIPAIMDVLATPSKVRHADQYRLVAECEDKINSGDLKATARVIRDMHRSNSAREIPYSVENIFNEAVRRLAEEVALVMNVTEDVARSQIIAKLTDERPTD